MKHNIARNENSISAMAILAVGRPYEGVGLCFGGGGEKTRLRGN